MAPEKPEDASVEDLEQIFKEHGHKPQIAHGLAVAARTVWMPNPRVKVKFLFNFLDQEYSFDPPDIFPLAGEIYAEVVRQLLEADSSFGLSGEQLQQLVDFLGQRPPIEGIRGKVKEFFVRITTELTCSEGMVSPRLWVSIARALLRYQLFDVLEVLVQQKVYHAVPALFEVVVEQVGEGNVSWLKTLVHWGWGDMADNEIVAAFRSVGSDTRVLRFLLELSQAHIDAYGGPYKLPGDNRRRPSLASW